MLASIDQYTVSADSNVDTYSSVYVGTAKKPGAMIGFLPIIPYPILPTGRPVISTIVNLLVGF